MGGKNYNFCEILYFTKLINPNSIPKYNYFVFFLQFLYLNNFCLILPQNDNILNQIQTFFKMKRTIGDTISEYRDEFLAGKSEAYKEKFEQKNEKQQYAAIQNWKRNAKNLAESTKDLAKVTANTVVSYLKDAHKKLQKLETLSPKEAEKLQGLLDSVRSTIDNFDRMKKEQYLAYLNQEKLKLQKQGENLDRQIEELKNKLG